MADLMLHRGARLAERPEVELIDAPPPTESWFPLSHATVLSTVERTLIGAGFGIQRMQLALSPDNSRFFGTLDLMSPITDGVSLTVGVRNSIDKTFPIGMVAGSRVMVCDNLAFSSTIYVSKKHTRWGADRFTEGISHAMQTLGQYKAVEAKRIAVYRDYPLGENEAAAVLLHAFEENVLSSRTLPAAIEAYRRPSLEEFAPRTAWSLFNACTESLKQRQGNPAEFASLTMKLYRLIDAQTQFVQAT